MSEWELKHIVLSIQFESFNDECVIIKEAYISFLLSQETK